MRRALRRLLGSHGYEVELFADGNALLAAQAEHQFDCILLDLHMPGLSGFDVMEQLSLAPHETKLIVITGKDEPGNAERVRDLGAQAYLLKPVDEEPLLAAIGPPSES